MNQLASFTRRDLRGWHGLARDTRLDDVARLATVDSDFAGAGKLGSAFEPAEWVTATLDGFPWGIRIWCRHDRVVLLDAEGAQPAGGLDALLAGLGPPAARWDAWLGSVRMAGSEWVYPDRGLTLYKIPGAGTVDRMLAYVATTIDGYARTLRPHTETHLLPEPGGDRR
ncbi:MAG TPA: hypothetical protein VFM55_14945 [Micromonosporaceae bacterium]|nr:hypothetical protein [Micromonosporaceae bacterium]